MRKLAVILLAPAALFDGPVAVHAQQALPPGQIDGSGDLRLGPVTPGKRQGKHVAPTSDAVTASSLTLDTLSLRSLGSTGQIGASTAALPDLRAMPTFGWAAGAVVQVGGSRAAGDGGGGPYVWSPTSTAADDGCTVIRPRVIGTSAPGRWLRASTTALTVRCFGAALNGSDDAAAFSAARAKVSDSGVIDVPPGNFNLSGVSGGPTTPILWRMSGNKHAGGSAITGIGNDVLETMFDGSKTFFKTTHTTDNRTPTLRIDHRLNYSGGTNGITVSAVKVNQYVGNQFLQDYAWSNSTTLYSSARGRGEHVALAAQAVRPSDALSDGQGARAQLWGLYTEARDDTNQGSDAGGSMVGHELDLYLNGPDPQNHRILMQMAFARSVRSGPKARVGKGITIGTNDIDLGYGRADWSYLGTGFELTSGWDVAGIDMSTGYAINGAPAIKIGDGQIIAVDGGKSGYNRSIGYGGGILAYKFKGNSIVAFDDNGRGHFAGGLNIPDQPAPASTSDPIGDVGDIRFNGPYMYRKTTSGWYRSAAFAPF